MSCSTHVGNIFLNSPPIFKLHHAATWCIGRASEVGRRQCRAVALVVHGVTIPHNLTELLEQDVLRTIMLSIHHRPADHAPIPLLSTQDVIDRAPPAAVHAVNQEGRYRIVAWYNSFPNAAFTNLWVSNFEQHGVFVGSRFRMASFLCRRSFTFVAGPLKTGRR
jgi:hypothetical protein